MRVIFLKVPFTLPPTVFWRQNRPSFVEFSSLLIWFLLSDNNSVLISSTQDMWTINPISFPRDKISSFLNEYLTVECVSDHCNI